MPVVIAINDANPLFAGLDMKHVQVVIGAVSQPPMFYNFLRNSAAPPAAIISLIRSSQLE